MQRIFFPSSKPRFLNEAEVISSFKRLALRAAEKDPYLAGVYLFGSYAQGNAGVHSDVDILVVFSNNTPKIADKLSEYILAFSKGPVPADVLTITRRRLYKEINEGNTFFARALKGLKLV